MSEMAPEEALLARVVPDTGAPVQAVEPPAPLSLEDRLDKIEATLSALIDSHNVIGQIIDNVGQNINAVAQKVQTEGLGGLLSMMGKNNG